jgi:hypothetical protein
MGAGDYFLAPWFFWLGTTVYQRLPQLILIHPYHALGKEEIRSIHESTIIWDQQAYLERNDRQVHSPCIGFISYSFPFVPSLIVSRLSFEEEGCPLKRSNNRCHNPATSGIRATTIPTTALAASDTATRETSPGDPAEPQLLVPSVGVGR